VLKFQDAFPNFRNTALKLQDAFPTFGNKALKQQTNPEGFKNLRGLRRIAFVLNMLQHRLNIMPFEKNCRVEILLKFVNFHFCAFCSRHFYAFN